MIVTCVHVHVKAENIGDFIQATTANHNESVKESGNLRFDLLQEADDPGRFVIYEAYESEEAAAEHKKTRHYEVWRNAVANWMAEPRRGIKYDIVAPADRTGW